jgi:hypothetical protein
MPIDTTHEQYDSIVARAKRVRDAIDGQECVHAGGKLYLPMLTEQTVDQYNAYRDRAGWYGATGRTHEGMVGMVFRRPPVLENGEGLDDIKADVDMAGTTLDGQARKVLAEVMAAARVGVLVEFPSVDAQPRTLAQAQANNLRPYSTVYTIEAIKNWRVERVNNEMRITMLVLQETVEEDGVDEYDVKTVEQLRGLTLESDGNGPRRYVQRVYRAGETDSKTKATNWVQVGADIVPTMNGQPLEFIPFYAFGPNENSLAIQRPPLQQLADVNFGHYRNTADLEHGAHFAGLPTPYVFGVMLKEGESIAIGSPTAITSTDPQCKAGFMEFTGTGLGALEKRCEVKEQQMAALGARMLAPEKSGVEAGETLAMRHTGESSVLAGMANLVSEGMTKVLRTMERWQGRAESDVAYKLNTDFMPQGLTAQDLTALVAAWQSGGISWETFFDNLKRGEIVSAETTSDDERERIDSAPPTLGMIAALKPVAGEGGDNADDE